MKNKMLTIASVSTSLLLSTLSGNCAAQSNPEGDSQAFDVERASLGTGPNGNISAPELNTRQVEHFCDLFEFEKAKTTCRQLLESIERENGTDSPEMLAALKRVAFIDDMRCDYPSAERDYKVLGMRYERATHVDKVGLAGTLVNLARVYASQKRYTDAETNLDRAIALGEKSKSKAAPFTVANALHCQASCFIEEKKYDQAEHGLERIISIYSASTAIKKTYCMEIAEAKGLLGYSLIKQNREKEAEELFHQEFSEERTLLGECSIALNALRRLGDLLQMEGKYDEAFNQFVQIEQVQEKHSGKNSEQVAAALLPIAQIYSKQKFVSRAEETYQRVFEIEERTQNPDKSILSRCLRQYIGFLREQGKRAQADECEKRLNTLLKPQSISES